MVASLRDGKKLRPLSLLTMQTMVSCMHRLVLKDTRGPEDGEEAAGRSLVSLVDLADLGLSDKVDLGPIMWSLASGDIQFPDRKRINSNPHVDKRFLGSVAAAEILRKGAKIQHGR
mmetsp:Transcript_35044/g.54759  ORF Transcript_35044/g.54759 Transcript_35044/m.54759 type:complete len:116 (+) Transcript_35044:129-476(+)